ncbi:MAG: aspartate carbamoyltransferase regulatory subunit [Muribaculaceae bacterium]|nr:aspartate carbamoyltransferase regulatory subunit [Muribaculaceae bacterium]MDE6321889.1 aspartate carbamoyltransferase regulatory subunit [Muribaculaceae bacterium]
MTTSKKELAVAALRSGTVIDHIPSSMLFKAVRILGIENLDTQLTIGNNLESQRLGTKGIIKVADVFFPEEIINRIALIAPTAVVNIIRDFNVVEKRQVVLPDTIVGIVKCDNPKCISNNEPMRSRFNVISRNPVTIRCHYCGHTTTNDKANV